jgi:3-carboxy-cis,cis-muconate cycloisomerase
VRCDSTFGCAASARRCSLPFEALFLPEDLREAVSDGAWLNAMLEAERALRAAEVRAGVVPAGEWTGVSLDADALAREGRRAGNPVEPLVRALRERDEHVHHGATSQDILDTAAALVTRDALVIVRRELDELASACAGLAEVHRATLMAARTLLQQATPTTFGLKAAQWLVALLDARDGLEDLPAQLGGAAGTLAALGDRGLEVQRLYAEELGLEMPELPWHTNRVGVARLGAGLAIAAGVAAKLAVDVELLAQSEVGEVRVPAGGVSSAMPHKQNPVGPTLTRACALHAQAASSILTAALVQEHERAAGAWHAEWKALSDGLAYSGAALAWMRETLEGLEVDADRMRANVQPGTLSEAERFGGAERPEDYLGAADALVERALERYRR